VPVVWHGEWSSPSAVTVDGETIVIFGDGYGWLHGFALPEKSEDGEPVILEELWTMDLNPRLYRFDEQGREHIYSMDRRLIHKYPLGWLEDHEKWIMPPEEWAIYEGKGETRDSYFGLPLDEVKFKRPHRREVPGPGKENGPAELIAMPVVIDNLVYLGIGRDYTYSRGPVPEGREYVSERKRPRRFTEKGRFMCLEFDDVKKAPRVRWEDRDIAHTQCNASVYNGLVYVADLGGFLNCWDAETGEVVYKIDVGASVRERSQMVVDGKVYVANDVNEFRVYTTGPEPELLAESEVKHWISTPCADDGVIVFTAERDVFAYGEPEKTEQENEE
jgi:outer membrane protein assembly factor BamB